MYQPSNYSTDFQKYFLFSVTLTYATLLRDTYLRKICMIEDLGLNIDAFLSCAIFVTVLFVNIECEIYNNCMLIKCSSLSIIDALFFNYIKCLQKQHQLIHLLRQCKEVLHVCTYTFYLALFICLCRSL